MASTDGTKIVAAVVPPDDTDTFATHKANYGEGGIHHVQSESDLQNITEQRQQEYMLATVSGRDGLLFQLVDEANDNWRVLDLGSSFKVVEDNAARDNISSDQREEGMIVAVRDPDADSTNEYKEYQLQGGTSNSDWQEVLVLTPSELQSEISGNQAVLDNTSSRHSHSNKSTLDDVDSDTLDIAVEIVVTNSDRDNIPSSDREEGMVAVVRDPDGDGSNEFKEYQLQGGTTDQDWEEIKWLTQSELNSFITSNQAVLDNTSARHTHNNKTELDNISSSGSGDIITPSERTDLQDNSSARHSHGNKSALDGISNSGSGSVISSTERNLIEPTRVTKTSDFTVSSSDYSVLYYADTSVNGSSITVTLPDNVGNFDNMWHVYVISVGNYEVVLQAASGAATRSPSGNKLVDQYAMASVFHFDEGGNSVWYLEGRLA